MPPQIAPQVQETLDAMTEAGIIKEITTYSPIISSLLIGKKKSGKPRLLLDSRSLNLQVQPIPSAITNSKQIFSFFSGKKKITTLDISNAYFAVPIKEDKQALFSFFDTKNRRMGFCRAPQGYKNSAPALERLTATLTEGINETICYVDDIYLASETDNFDTHLKSLEELFRRIKIARIKIKPEKLNLCGETLDIIGYIWSNGKFSIPAAKVSAIRNFATPKNTSGVRSFLATTNYFRAFIFRYAEISAPLNDLTKKEFEKSFRWTPEAKKAFDDLKQAIATAIKLSAPMLTARSSVLPMPQK